MHQYTELSYTGTGVYIYVFVYGSFELTNIMNIYMIYVCSFRHIVREFAYKLQKERWHCSVQYDNEYICIICSINQLIYVCVYVIISDNVWSVTTRASVYAYMCAHCLFCAIVSSCDHFFVINTYTHISPSLYLAYRPNHGSSFK